jgi:phage baseplate assembly protein W
MGSFSFKSVGKTKEEQVANTLIVSPTPIGIKTPLEQNSNDGFLAMHYSLADQVHDNLRNLILTNWGERVGLYRFGANLRPITTEFVSQDDFDSQAIERISNAVSTWMPFVSLENFVSVVDHTNNKNTAIVRLTVTYSIPAISQPTRALEVTLYVI